MMINLFGITPSQDFEDFICESDDAKYYNIRMKKKKVINEFKNFNKVSCAQNGTLQSILFIIYRSGKSAISPNFKINEKSKIVEWVKEFEKGDKVEIQLIFKEEHITKRSKILYIE